MTEQSVPLVSPALTAPIDVITTHLPLQHGRAADRALLAWVEGARMLGADVRVHSWAPTAPQDSLPDWCTWSPLPQIPHWRLHARALVAPRTDVRRSGWQARPGAWAVADDMVSVAAVVGLPKSVLVAHYATRLDIRAVRRVRPTHVQDLRLEYRCAQSVAIPTAYSARVAKAIGPMYTVPIALQPPPTAVPVVDRPVAVLPADWSWPPNVAALLTLLSDWPTIREQVPGATLLLAGPHLPEMSLPAGVTALGRLPSLNDLWASAAVLAFPCPPSSGPKVKVLEAAMAGVPVVTTVAGVEGLDLNGVVVTPAKTFAATLAGVLADPARRSDLADRCRASAIASHAPVVAATRRLEAWTAATDDRLVERPIDRADIAERTAG